MDDEVYLPFQAFLVAGVGVLLTLSCGDPAAIPSIIVLVLGAIVCLAFGLSYTWRRQPAARKERGAQDRRAAVICSSSFAVALSANLATLLFGFEGLFSSSTIAFVAVVVLCIPVAILASSMVDWYLIRPLTLGAFGPPIWARPDDEQGQRRIAQYWIAHRGLCELVVFSAIALILAAGLVALERGISSDDILLQAIESIGGAGIAVAVLGYAGPRWRESLGFVLAAPVGVGSWARGHDELGRPVEGLVADVSVWPGVKLALHPEHRSTDRVDARERCFVALGAARYITPVSRPKDIDACWFRVAMLRHFGKEPNPDHDGERS